MKTKEQLVSIGLTEKQADDVMLLESKMMETAVRFQFKKKDNAIRDAYGTLVRNKMLRDDGSLWNPIGEPKPEAVNIVKYWDLEAKSWRCFDVTRFIGICTA